MLHILPILMIAENVMMAAAIFYYLANPATNSKGRRMLRWAFYGFSACFVLFLCACSANEVGTVETIITAIGGIAPLVAGLGAAIDPSEATAITNAANLVTTGLSTVKTTLAAYQANPGTGTLGELQAAMNAVQANLPALQSAAQIKDPATATKITSIATAATSLLSGIELTVLAKHPATVAAASATTS